MENEETKLNETDVREESPGENSLNLRNMPQNTNALPKFPVNNFLSAMTLEEEVDIIEFYSQRVNDSMSKKKIDNSTKIVKDSIVVDLCDTPPRSLDTDLNTIKDTFLKSRGETYAISIKDTPTSKE